VEIPALPFESFASRLRAAAGPELGQQDLRALFAHYEELRRWAPKVDLVGPGAAARLPEEHYAEALVALPWLPVAPFHLLDVGSGAGFPGFVLAAARPDTQVTLVEPRARRAAFLRAAARRAGLGLSVVAARVGDVNAFLPESIEIVTLRALRFEAPIARAVAPHLAPGASILLFCGEAEPDLPAGFERGREAPIVGSRVRRLVELRFRGSPE
jgi:16S rRNA (guanine527-N7)-methyltransferase